MLDLEDRRDRVRATLEWLRPVAAPAAAEAEFSRWIGACNADPDQSEDWCTSCAEAEVERLNAEHPNHEYFVDGGWGSSTDVPPYCCKCGKTLDDYLTKHAVESEVSHYSANSVGLRGNHGPDLAFRFTQILDSDDFDLTDASTWRFFRKIERMYLRRVCTRFATPEQTDDRRNETIPPEQWKRGSLLHG